MKIGIITYHFARNYGAILQCYALQSYLKAAGYHVEVLDYMTEQQERNNSLHHKRNNPAKNLAVNLALLPFEGKRRSKERKFAEFEHGRLPLSPRLRTLAELSRYINDGEFDLLISGSDQVFNPKIDDFDEAFLLPFETAAIKASFAASFGGASKIDVLGYRDFLCDFDYLCVRERSDAPMVFELCGRDPKIVDDPVFLLEREEWERVGVRDGFGKSEGYVLGYFINKEVSPRYLELTRRASEVLDLPMLVINVRFGPDSFRNGMITDAGPLEFLQLFSGASFVCTDSFHGTAFSLIYGKPFVSFEPKAGSNDWRKRDLLRKTNQQRRSVAVDCEEALIKVTELVGECPPNVDEALKKIREAQIEYLGLITGLIEDK
ncbi:MAG: polysaccharide pyruvyl transferase family protein [Eggerthellaceae bacterium]|nr:polysaccharide pyruvyl transferase family protein [Eggerthellaceae bacterium]